MAPKLNCVFLVSICLFAFPKMASSSQDGASALHGTWRWVDTVGALLPARGTPQSCNCARVLTLASNGSYRYFWPDSSGGHLLAEGSFSVRDSLHDAPSGTGASFRVEFTPSFDNKRHSFPGSQKVRFVSPDTIAFIASAIRHPSRDLIRRYVRELGFIGNPPKPRAETVMPSTPPGEVKDSLSIGQVPGPYEDPPIPVSWSQSAGVRWLQGTSRDGDVLIRVLIGADGRMAGVGLVRGKARTAPPALSATEHWVFKPALMSGKPVATWIEIPFQLVR